MAQEFGILTDGTGGALGEPWENCIERSLGHGGASRDTQLEEADDDSGHRETTGHRERDLLDASDVGRSSREATATREENSGAELRPDFEKSGAVSESVKETHWRKGTDAAKKAKSVRFAGEQSCSSLGK